MTAAPGIAVMKFGGTSVADPAAVERLIGIVQAEHARSDGPPLVVVSALAGVTDNLVKLAQLAEDGQKDRAEVELSALVDRHVRMAETVTGGGPRGSVISADVEREFNEVGGLIHALSVLREVSPRSLDAVLAAGELASSRMVAAALDNAGIGAEWVDARNVMVTDADHTAAAPDMIETADRARDGIVPIIARGHVPVVGGFVGATIGHVTTTLGRGGSDYSAAIFGACLDAREIQIWTDVDGMLTADPRIVSSPRVVPCLTFAEASELAYFGAKVLHPSTILPAVGKNIPVRILNSRRSQGAGTMITADASRPNGPLAAIACKRDVTLIDITSSRMLMAHGFLRRLFEVFERFKTSVDVVTTSEVSVSVTVDDTRRLDAVVDNLQQFAQVACEGDMAIVCAVGENLRTDPTLFGRAIMALDRIPLRLVSQAASRRNVTFVLRSADVGDAMTRLHETFF